MFNLRSRTDDDTESEDRPAILARLLIVLAVLYLGIPMLYGVSVGRDAFQNGPPQTRIIAFGLLPMAGFRDAFKAADEFGKSAFGDNPGALRAYRFLEKILVPIPAVMTGLGEMLGYYTAPKHENIAHQEQTQGPVEESSTSTLDGSPSAAPQSELNPTVAIDLNAPDAAARLQRMLRDRHIAIVQDGTSFYTIDQLKDQNGAYIDQYGISEGSLVGPGGGLTTRDHLLPGSFSGSDLMAAVNGLKMPGDGSLDDRFRAALHLPVTVDNDPYTSYQ